MPNGKPNILVIWGDDIGYWNLSCYSRGMMGYQTPNIDRIAHEGILFHRLLRRAKLHSGPRRLHYGPERVSLRTEQGRLSWCCHWDPTRRPDNCRAVET